MTRIRIAEGHVLIPSRRAFGRNESSPPQKMGRAFDCAEHFRRFRESRDPSAHDVDFCTFEMNAVAITCPSRLGLGACLEIQVGGHTIPWSSFYWATYARLYCESQARKNRILETRTFENRAPPLSLMQLSPCSRSEVDADRYGERV